MTKSEYISSVERLYDRIVRYAFVNIGSSVDAQDIAQETFVVIWNNLRFIEHDKCKSFAFATAHNLILKYFTYRNKFEQHINVNDVENNIKNETSKVFECLDYISKTTVGLNSKWRECLLLKDWEGYSYKEIALILDISEVDAKVSVFRAKQKLKEFREKEI